jgi:hypothetical protein
LNADPDPATQINADPDTDPPPCLLLLKAGVQLGPGPAQLPAEGFQQRQSRPVQNLCDKEWNDKNTSWKFENRHMHTMQYKS